MIIQLALDRLSIPEAIEIASGAEAEVEWIEVGTSLIKEFGVKSIYEIKKRFPNKTIIADVKTFDNAKYEFELCFNAGADIATVMGAAPMVTIETCLEVAKKYGKKVMIDLLNTSEDNRRTIQHLQDVIVCKHISKDQQEEGDQAVWDQEKIPSYQQLAVAGGISFTSLPELNKMNPDVLIIGSAISKAKDPSQAAKKIKEAWRKLK